MPTKVRLTRIESSHNNLRTNSVEGFLHTELKVGNPIVVTAAPLNKSFDARAVTTTDIERIEGNRYYTRNSIYEIEVL
jgi:hypothetical protein